MLEINNYFHSIFWRISRCLTNIYYKARKPLKHKASFTTFKELEKKNRGTETREHVSDKSVNKLRSLESEPFTTLFFIPLQKEKWRQKQCSSDLMDLELSKQKLIGAALVLLCYLIMSHSGKHEIRRQWHART